MKKRLLLVTILFVTSFSACTIANPKIPYGVWESIDPAIVAYISPEIGWDEINQGYTFEATYITGASEAKELSVAFNRIDGRMMIYELRVWDSGAESHEIYFSGDFKVRKDTLTMHVVNQVLAGTDYEEIVFTKIQDYDEVTE